MSVPRGCLGPNTSWDSYDGGIPCHPWLGGWATKPAAVVRRGDLLSSPGPGAERQPSMPLYDAAGCRRLRSSWAGRKLSAFRTTGPFVVAVPDPAQTEDIPGFVERGLPESENFCRRSTTGQLAVAPHDLAMPDDFPGFVERGHLAGDKKCGRSTTGPFVVPPRELVAADDVHDFVQRGRPDGDNIRGRRTTRPFVIILGRPPRAEDFWRFVRLRRNHAIPP